MHKHQVTIMRAVMPFRSTLLILGLTIFSTGIGCRSGFNGGESVWKRPNLSGLAFWKKEAASVPKPPAVHFDPTPAQTDTQLAGKNTAADVKDSLDKMAKLDSEPHAKTKSGTKSENETKAEQQAVKPLRAPYQLSSSQPNSTPPSSSSTNSSPTSSSPTKPSQPIVGSQASATVQPMAKTNPGNHSDFVATPPISPAADKSSPTGADPVLPISISADQARAKFNADMQGLKASVAKDQNRLANLSQPVEQNLVSSKPMISAEQRRLEAEVARAQQEIAELKSRLANNSKMLAPLAASNSAPMANQNVQMTGNATGSQPSVNSARFDGASQPPKSNSAGFAPLRPSTRVSTVGSPATHKGSATDVKLAPVSNQYPVTTESEFATANQAGLAISRVEEAVRPAGLNVPAHPAGIGAAESAYSGVNDIDIPESVLKGKGTFAPGSVNRLRGN
jgi:hypothetical protein